MKYRKFYWLSIGIAINICLMVAPSSAMSPSDLNDDSQGSRPNILLIIGDDIGLDVTTDMYPGLIDELQSQYGPQGLNHPDYQRIRGRPASTPSLDQIAAGGMRFNQVWVQPFCSPTRVSMLTGLYASRTGVLDYRDWLSQNQHSFVKDLQQAGYQTAAFGKWHMAGLNEYPGMKPKEAGFDLFQGNLNGAIETYWNYDYQVQDDSTAEDVWIDESPPRRSLEGIAATTFAPVVKVSDAQQWILKQRREKPKAPWFAWLAFNLSHISVQQEPNPMAVPNVDTLDETSRAEIEACGGQFGSANVGDCSSEALMRAMTNAMDTVIGKLLKTIEEVSPNTYIIYLGDNGTWMFGPRREFIDNMYITRQGRGKGTAYESGVRVSMAVSGPGIALGSQSNAFIHGVDLFATILEMAGLEVPDSVPDRSGQHKIDLDSVSLMPLLTEQASEVRDNEKDYVSAETINPLQNELRQVAVRNARYKVLCSHNTEIQNCHWFDLVRDPLEEFPLEKPDACSSVSLQEESVSQKEDADFCHLLKVITQETILSTQ